MAGTHRGNPLITLFKAGLSSRGIFAHEKKEVSAGHTVSRPAGPAVLSGLLGRWDRNKSSVRDIFPCAKTSAFGRRTSKPPGSGGVRIIVRASPVFFLLLLGRWWNPLGLLFTVRGT